MHARLLLALLLTLPALAQDPVQGPDGTAQISGRVLAADTNQPIPNAQVAVSLATLNPPQWTRPVQTDKDGHYEIHWLPAASFLVQATADGFVAQIFHDPAITDPAASQLVTVPDAALIPSIDFALASAGSLHGLVVDATGDPVAEGVSVSAAQPSAAKSWSTLATTRTDPTGHFSLKRLAPGSYAVCVNGPRDSSPSKSNITYRQTCLGDTPTPDGSQTVEVRAGDSGPDLRIVAPRIAGHTLTLVPSWPTSPSDPAAPKPDHFTAQLSGGYTGIPSPDGSQVILNLPPGHYHATLSAFQSDQLLGKGQSDLDMPAADLRQKISLKPTPPDAP